MAERLEWKRECRQWLKKVQYYRTAVIARMWRILDQLVLRSEARCSMIPRQDVAVSGV